VALASQPQPSNLSFPLAFQLALAFLTTSLNTQSDQKAEEGHGFVSSDEPD